MCQALCWALQIQADLILLCFADTALFYKLNVCGNPVSTKSTGDILPTAFAHFVSPYHILTILVLFQTFSLLLYLLA